MADDRKALIKRVSKQFFLILSRIMAIIDDRKSTGNYPGLINLSITDPSLDRKVMINSLSVADNNKVLVRFTIDGKNAYFTIKASHTVSSYQTVEEIAYVLFGLELDQDWVFIPWQDLELGFDKKIPCDAKCCLYKERNYHYGELTGCYREKWIKRQVCDWCFACGEIEKGHIGDELAEIIEELTNELIGEMNGK